MIDAKQRAGNGLAKEPTGIPGLDILLEGGLPAGRLTLVCGGPGTGKTVLGMQILAQGALEADEPGVFLAFEEDRDELLANMTGFGWDLASMERSGKLVVDSAGLSLAELREAGAFDLSGLFVRLQAAMDQVGARRVVIDTIESLFTAIPDVAVVRAELVRLMRWLRDRGVTAFITAPRGNGALTRYGIEEYITDCVILLDQRVAEQGTTRWMRVVKYRGSGHVNDEVPFLIGSTGFSVLPLVSLPLDYQASDRRLSTGVPTLDDMLGGGYYEGSAVLVSGTAGSGKSSLAAHLLERTCRDGGRAAMFAFEESESVIVRNMRSIGIDLAPWLENDRLRIVSCRPGRYGLESHLVAIHKAVVDFKPSVLVLDPISGFEHLGTVERGKSMVTRVLDLVRREGVTTLMTNLVKGGGAKDQTDIGVSSIMDTWISVRDVESDGERNRAIYIIKARGMAHSNQVREFLLTPEGIQLRPVYTGPAGVLVGTARAVQEAAEESDARNRAREIERLERHLEGEQRKLEARVAALRAESEAAQDELSAQIDRAKAARSDVENASGRARQGRVGGKDHWTGEDEQ